MPALTHVDLDANACSAFDRLLEQDDLAVFERAMAATAQRLDGRTVWMINSTAEGGGVAEMLGSLMPYAIGCGWDVRWVVMSGDENFFDVTKGLHNALHGVPPSEDIWDDAPAVYEATTERAARELSEIVRRGDVALVHDPQVAGLIGPLSDAGVGVSWQCHIGTDTPNECTTMAWDLLRPHILPAPRYVFTRDQYLWDGLDPKRMRVIPPSIDAFSSKNIDLEDVDSILAGAQIFDGPSERKLTPVQRTGGIAPIPRDARIVLQVSRWDRLKDPLGFIRMFAGHLADIPDLHAVYAGPAPEGVDDDPEARDVVAACAELWRSLHPDVRTRMHLLSIPMRDIDENATVVNALQRRADVVVQKSIEEGFGLTVAEAMWKSRPVVASRVGGIQDQIEHGKTGLLVDDPYDIDGFAQNVRGALDDTACAQRLGRAAHNSVRDNYLGPRQLRQYAELLSELT
jgi:trehalose synthase